MACASHAGHGARAVVRVSGPRTRDVLAALGHTPPEWRRGVQRAVLTLRHEDGLASLGVPVLCIAFAGPASYTGEDAADLLMAGHPHLVALVLQALVQHSEVRLAQPGEFTARAFHAGKLTLDQVEGVAAVIAAQTQEDLDAGRALLDGSVGARYRAWSDELTTLAALVEAGIDFTDQEDVVAIAPHALAARLERVRHEMLAFAGGADGVEQADARVVAALVGEPNAGKSTLFNALLARTRAVASPRAGTTRDVLQEALDVSDASGGARSVILQDLAGLSTSHEAESASDIAARDAAREAIARADVLVWCDPSGRFDDARLAALAGCELSAKRVLRVRTFGDRVATGQGREALAVCGLDGWHVRELARALGEMASSARARGALAATAAPRHQAAIARARAAIDGAIAEVDTAAHSLERAEVVAQHLRDALHAMGELTGSVITPDDVLGRIFATFCVGK